MVEKWGKGLQVPLPHGWGAGGKGANKDLFHTGGLRGEGAL
jgi:hypothetical protein